MTRVKSNLHMMGMPILRVVHIAARKILIGLTIFAICTMTAVAMDFLRDNGAAVLPSYVEMRYDPKQLKIREKYISTRNQLAALDAELVLTKRETCLALIDLRFTVELGMRVNMPRQLEKAYEAERQGC